MDFKQFRYFVTVAEELHVRRAAEKLHIAQPALSQQIQQMEARLGTPLFDREKRRLSLTDAGRLFLEEARLALHQADRAVQIVEHFGRGEVGQIKIGYVDSAMLGSATRRILSQFKTTHPNVEQILSSRNVADQFGDVIDGRLDMGIVRGPLPNAPDKLRCQLIERENLVVCLPARHALRDRDAVSMLDLKDEGFVLPHDPAGIGLAGQISLLGQEAGFVPMVHQYAAQAATLACLVASGFGVTLLPESLRQLHLPDIVYKPLRPAAATQLFLLSRMDERYPAVRALLHIAAEVSGSVLTPR